jgi:tetratricopeptide (TPR) repeat protein/Zn-dependent protease with chaperone function
MNLHVVLETGWSALLPLTAQIALVVALTALLLWKLRDAAWKRALWQTCFLCLAGLLAFSVFDLKERFFASGWNRTLSANATEAVEVMAGEAVSSSELERRPSARREPLDGDQLAGSETGAPMLPEAPALDSALRIPHSAFDQSFLTPAPAFQAVAEDVSTSPTPFWWFWLGWAGGAVALLARLMIARLALAGFCWRYRLNFDNELGERVRLLAGRLGLKQRIIVRVLYPRGSPATPLTPALSPRCAKGEGEDMSGVPVNHLDGATDDPLSLHPMRGEGARRAGEGCHLRTPIAFGLFLPSIALPADFTRRFSHAEQDAMLAHELAHLAARDPLWYLLADVLCALLWWHPLVWWARSQLHTASELSADEASLFVEGGPQSLAGCLVRLAGELTRPAALESIGVEGDGFRSRLGRRVERLLRLADNPAAATAPRPSGWVKVLGPVVLLALLLTGTGWIAPDALRQPGDWQSRFHSAWDGLYAALPDAPEEVAQSNADNAPKKSNPATPIEEPSEADTNAISAASHLLREGQLLYEQGQHKAAEAKLLEAIKLNPLNQPAYYYLSLIHEARRPDEIKLRSAFEAVRNQAAKELQEKLVAFPSDHPEVIKWQGAVNHLDKVLAQVEDRMKGQATPSTPREHGPRNPPVSATKSRQAILRKLDSIRLPEVHFDGLPLSEVMKFLHEESKRLDPEKKGVAILVNPNLEWHPYERDGKPVLDPTGQPYRITLRKDMDKVIVRLSAPLADLTLAQALDVVVKFADQPIMFIVEDYAVVFTSGLPTGPRLFTRTYKVDPSVFMQGLQSVIQRPSGVPGVAVTPQQGGQTTATGSAAQGASTVSRVSRGNPSEVSNLVREYFVAAGVDLSTNTPGQPSMVFYDEHTGGLMVRAAPEILEKVQAKLNELPKPPPLPTTDKIVFSGAARGAITVKPGEKHFLVKTLLASGWTDSADVLWVKVQRVDPKTGGTNVTEVNVNAILNSLKGNQVRPDFQLQAGDQVQVMERWPTSSTGGAASAVPPPAVATTPQLYTRTFKVDPQVFVQGMVGVIARPLGVATPAQQGTQTGNTPNTVALAAPTPTSVRTNNTADISEAVRQYFIRAGVNLGPNQTGQSPMVFYNDSRGILMVRATAEDLAIISKKVEELTKFEPQIRIKVVTVRAARPVSDKPALARDVAKFTQGGPTMTTWEYHTALQEWKSRAGVELEELPLMTTIDGRQAHFSAATETEFDVLPRLYPDGFSMEVVAIASSRQPDFRMLGMIGRTNIWDGETIVLTETNKAANAKGEVLHCITLSVVDPAGRPARTPEEIDRQKKARPILPAHDKAYFYGEAKGMIQIPPGEKRYLAESLRKIGWSAWADLNRVKVHRLDPKSGELGIIAVNASAILLPATGAKIPPDFELQADDSVQVPAKLLALSGNQGAAPPPPASPKPAQVMIEAKLAEISDSVARELGLLWFTANPAMAAVADAKVASTTISQPAPDTNRVVSVNAIANMSTLLTDAQFGALLRTLEQKSGVDVLSAPRVTTLSGREALVEISDVLTLVVGRAEDGTPVTRVISVGPKLHLLPTATRDGASVALDWQMTFNEFLGYDEPPKEAKDTAILPRVRERVVKRSDTVPAGQTLMVGWGSVTDTKVVRTKVPVLGDIPGVGRLFRGKKEVTPEPRHVLIFLTPVLVDEDGKPVKP